MQIYIDDQEKYTEAINIIEGSIQNLREKVDILKIYGPKILKNSSNQKQNNLDSLRYGGNRNNVADNQSDRLVNLVKSISLDVIALAMGTFKDKATKGYTPG